MRACVTVIFLQMKSRVISSRLPPALGQSLSLSLKNKCCSLLFYPSFSFVRLIPLLSTTHSTYPSSTSFFSPCILWIPPRSYLHIISLLSSAVSVSFCRPLACEWFLSPCWHFQSIILGCDVCFESKKTCYFLELWVLQADFCSTFLFLSFFLSYLLHQVPMSIFYPPISPVSQYAFKKFAGNVIQCPSISLHFPLRVCFTPALPCPVTAWADLCYMCVKGEESSE